MEFSRVTGWEGKRDLRNADLGCMANMPTATINCNFESATPGLDGESVNRAPVMPTATINRNFESDADPEIPIANADNNNK